MVRSKWAAAVSLSHPPAEPAGGIPGASSGERGSGGEFCCIAPEAEIANPSVWFVSRVPKKEAQ